MQILMLDELESFRSTWRQEIQKQKSHSPPRYRTRARGQEAAVSESLSSPRETSPRQSLDGSPLRQRIKTPLEMYESAILKERQGSLSEAVIQYRKAFKVAPLLLVMGGGTDLDGSGC